MVTQSHFGKTVYHVLFLLIASILTTQPTKTYPTITKPSNRAKNSVSVQIRHNQQVSLKRHRSTNHSFNRATYPRSHTTPPQFSPKNIRAELVGLLKSVKAKIKFTWQIKPEMYQKSMDMGGNMGLLPHPRPFKFRVRSFYFTHPHANRPKESIPPRNT